MDDEKRPPARIRITRLQEAQLRDLVSIDRAAAAAHHAAGVDPSLVVGRTDVEIARLHRTHDVYVAEADHDVAGFLAWRDVPPKLALLDILAVEPTLQRFGIGSRLLRAMGERCTEVGIDVVVTRCWEAAGWATAFLAATGFRPAGTSSPPPPAVVEHWLQSHASPDDRPAPGQRLFWRSTDAVGVKVIPGVPLPT